MKITMTTLEGISAFLREKIAACKFVGLSEQGELFVEFEHNNPQYMQEAKDKIQAAFPDEVKSVVAVVKPSIEQITQMIDDLNGLLEERPEKAPPKKEPLLDIGSF